MHSSPDITSDLLQQTMQSVTLAGSVRDTASRTLKSIRNADPSIQNTSENMRLVASLKQLGISRINSTTFAEWKQKVTFEESLEHPLFLVSKAAQPELDKNPEVAPWIYGESEVHGNVDKTQYWFVDQACPQRLLGKGVRTWKSKVVASRSTVIGQPSAQLALTQEAAPAVHELPEGDRNKEEVPETGAANSEVGANKFRYLSRKPSEADKTEEQLTDDMLAATKDAFHKSIYVLSNPLLPWSAEFQLREYMHYILEKKKLGDSQGQPLTHLVKEHMQVYLKFFLRWALEADTYAVMPRFLEHLKVMREKVPEVVPVMYDAVEKIVAFDLNHVVKVSALAERLGLDTVGLSRSQREFLFACEYYRGFLRAVRNKQMELAEKNEKLDARDRLAMIEDLLEETTQASLSEQAKAGLKFAQSILTLSNKSASAAFLLQTPEAFELLKHWFPTHALAVLAPLGIGYKYKNAAAADFCRAVMFYSSNVELSVDSAISHPMVLELIQFYRKIKEAGDGFMKFGAALFMETCVVKLALDEKSLMKWSEEHPILLSSAEACVPRAKELLASSKVSRGLRPSKNYPILFAVIGEPEGEKSQEEKEDQKSKVKNDAGKEKADFEVGDEVYVRSGTKREDYEGYKAKVLGTLASGKKLRFEMMEGPLQGKISSREVDKFTLVAEAAASSQQGTVAPAGQKQTKAMTSASSSAAAASSSSAAAASKPLKEDLVMKHFGEEAPDV